MNLFFENLLKQELGAVLEQSRPSSAIKSEAQFDNVPLDERKRRFIGKASEILTYSEEVLKALDAVSQSVKQTVVQIQEKANFMLSQLESKIGQQYSSDNSSIA